MKIIFFGSSGFSVPFLEKIYNSEHEIMAVVTNPDRETGRGKKILSNPVKICASGFGLKYFEINKMDEGICTTLASLNFDGIVVVSFGHLIPEKLIDISNDIAINVHPSLLPKYRGPSPIISALINGDEETGVSIMKIEKTLDTGPILAQAKFKIGINDNQDIVEKKAIEIGGPLLISVLNLIGKGLIEPFLQTGKSTYTQIFKTDDFKINWNENSFNIRNRIRAFSPEPGAFTFYKNSFRVKILNAAECGFIDEETREKLIDAKYLPGAVICSDKAKGLIIKCGRSEALRILELKIEGRSRMSFIDFLNGYKLAYGDYFN